MTTIRQFQDKAEPLVDGRAKVSVTILMAAMAVEVVSMFGKKCILVLDAYFAAVPVFAILQQAKDCCGQRLAHLVTRAKSNVVAYQDAPLKTGMRGRPRKYGAKLKLMQIFKAQAEDFEQATIELYGKPKSLYILCLDLMWKPLGEKIRFVLVADGAERFILMCSDLTLSASDIILAYSYRFKIEVSFKVLKHLMGTFFYRFWTYAWPRIGKQTVSDLSQVAQDVDKKPLISQTANAIEAFANFGCIATGILQIIALDFHQTIWSKHLGWLRTVTSTIPSEEIVKSVIQEEYYFNFRSFNNCAIYPIIMSKSRKPPEEQMSQAA